MRLFFISCMLVVIATPILSFTASEAMNYRDPKITPAIANLRALQAVSNGADLGLAGYLTGYASEDSKNNYSLNLRFLRDPLVRVNAARAADEAADEVKRITRNGINEALQAHASLLNAQYAAAAVTLREEAAAMKFAEAKRKLTLGALTDLDVEYARLEMQDALLSRQQAEKGLAIAEKQAARLGFTGPADDTLLLFQMPLVAVDDLMEMRSLQWNLQAAKKNRIVTRRNTMPALGTDVSYLGSDFQMSSSLNSRDRSITMLIGYPSLYDNTSVLFRARGWQTTFKIDVPIDPVAWGQARAANAELSLSQIEITSARERLAIELQQRQNEAVEASEALLLARKRADVAAQKEKIMQQKVAAGIASEIDGLAEKAASAEARANMALRWQGYLAAMAALLALSNSEWEAV